MNTRPTIPNGERPQRAFTLIELLVVIVIIGLIAKVALPSIKNMTKSNAMISANRQLLDDLAFARRSAIANHTTVYVVFVPPWIATDPQFSDQNPLFNNDPKIKKILTNLYQGQFTTYALISLRSVGDQPGRNTARYLSEWRSLPNGIFISPWKYTNTYNWIFPVTAGSEFFRTFPKDTNTVVNVVYPTFPFPVASSNYVNAAHLPFIGFDYLGRLINTNFQNEVIPLARGSIFYNTQDGHYVWGTSTVDVLETPAGSSSINNFSNSAPAPGTDANAITVDWLTGKARVIKTEIQ